MAKLSYNEEYSESRGYNFGIAHEVGLEAACVYNQLAFWQRIKGRHEWFYKSYAEMQRELPLTEYQLRKAYKVLESAGYIETGLTKVSGAPTLHFRILKNFRMDSEKTSLSMDSEKTSLSINNKTPIKHIHSQDPELASRVRAVHQLYLKSFKVPHLDQYSLLPPAKLLEQAERRYKLTPKRAEAIKRRLKDAGYDMLCAAIVGYSRESWYQGENESGWVADLERFICRNYENVEKGANKYEQQQKLSKSNDPWADL